MQLLFVSLSIVLLTAPVAEAQIELTESDRRALVGERVATKVFRAESPSSFSSFFNQEGENPTFDFTPFDYEVLFSGSEQGWKIQNAPSDVPFVSHFENRGANVVTQVRFEAEQTQASDTTLWRFSEVTPSNSTFQGLGLVSNRDIDQDGEAPDSVRADWSPPLEDPLPITFEDTWEQFGELSFGAEEIPATTSTGREHEVDAFGTLETPFGSAPALRIRVETTDTVSTPFGSQVTETTALDFATKDGRLGATIIRNDDNGDIASVELTVRADEGEAFQIAEGETRTLDGPGARVELTEGSTADGTLGISRFDAAPFGNTFSGSATSDDGTSVTPDVVWRGRHFVVQSQGLEDVSADVCIDTGPVGGIHDSGRLVVLTREAAGEDWSPLDSRLDGDRLCASVSSFSQFAVGANSDSNPLPVEMAGFEGTTTESGVRLTWQTASETGNAGFEVQRRAAGEPEAAWQKVGFVESKADGGTTDEPLSYRFEDEDLPYAADGISYRLRQVDLDGTESGTETVTVERTVERLELRRAFPNPARSQATVRFAVPERQDVRLELYDVLGRQLRTVQQGEAEGRQERQIDLRGLASGTYFLRLRAEGQIETRRLSVVR